MFEDEKDDSTELSEFENWYDENFIYFKRESKKQSGPTFDISLFYYGVYKPAKNDIVRAIRKLMVKQYPVIDTEFRPLVLEYINWLVTSTGHRLLLNLYILIQDQKEGINLRNKYPDFATWIDIYARPQEPDLRKYEDYDKFSFYSDLQKMQLIEEENKEIIKFFEIQEKRRKEFYDMIQPIIFKFYPVLNDLGYDGWIVYAYQIRNDYDDYKFRCEHIEKFIEYEFPEEDINLKDDEFQAKFRRMYNEKWERKHHFPGNGLKGNN